MPKLRSLLLFLLFSGLQAPLLAGEKNPVGVICLGDSITKRGYPKILEKLTGVTVINAGADGHTSTEGLRRMPKFLEDRRSSVLRIGQKRQIPVIDLYTLLPKEPKWMSPDGVHPTAEGSAFIARHIAKTVSPLLKTK